MEETFEQLEWSRIVEAVRGRCRGPAATTPGLPLAASLEGTRKALAETAEALAALHRGDPVPVDGIRDVALPLSRVQREGVLTGPELRDIGATLAAARVLRQYLGRNRALLPALLGACAFDPTLDDLEDRLASMVEKDGRLADHASPELRALRAEVANVRARLVARLEELVRQHAAALSDTFYTLREGRYVLPMRADAHDRIQGIVHGTSQSGATIFIEPRAIIAHGNRLKIAEGEMEREEARLLGILSEEVREQHASVVAAYDSLCHADLRAASARFGADLRGRIVPVTEAPRMALRGARHPVLALAGVAVVPNDLPIEGGEALVISGPNAGGKTVALKTLGLAALMVRAGLPLLVEEDSSAGFFANVFADVGDSQSIAKNLSTFSAHMRSVVAMLERADGATLVLLDELAGGTDPAEGAGLACALVEAFQARGAAVVVTTHYEALKALAGTSPRVRNASVGFDVEHLSPTFELRIGVPGSSSALWVAEKFGLARSVIERARAFVPEEVGRFETLVTSLRAALDGAEQQREALAAERAGVARREAELAAQLEAVRGRDKRALSEEALALKQDVERVREALAEARKRLRDARPDDAGITAATAALAEGRASLETLGARVEDGQVSAARREAGGEAGAVHLAPGARVWVERFGADAEVLSGPDRGRYQVAVGAMKVWVTTEEVAPPSRPKAKKADAPRRAVGPAPDAPRVMTSDNTLDLRGFRVDEALGAVDAFLDRLFGEGAAVAYLHHGVGTGALKEAIRGHLRVGAPYTITLRPGTLEEGGDKLTVVEFRERG